MFVDISATWHQKLAAWHCYAGEARAFPFPRSDPGLDALAKVRGMQAHVERAEGFRLVRPCSNADYWQHMWTAPERRMAAYLRRRGWVVVGAFAMRALGDLAVSLPREWARTADWR